MPVAKSAVREWLKRRLRDSSRAKNLTERSINAKLRGLSPVPTFNLDPMHHQKVCFLLGVKYPSYLFLLDMGLGKTALSLNLFRWRLARGEARRMLVLVPNTSNIEAWRSQVAEHTPELSFGGLDSDLREEREAVVLGDARVVVCTYAGWLALTCRREVSAKSGKNHMVPDDGLIRHYGHSFDMLVLDESTAVKNSVSVTFRVLRRMRRLCKYRMALTGTPFGRDPQDLWSQFYLMDGGETLGETLGLFRAAFFRKKKNYWGGWDYEFDPKKQDQLHRLLRHRSIRYSAEECLDLPSQSRDVRRTVLSADLWRYYDLVTKELREAEGNYALMKNAFVRMRQVCSGFLCVSGEDGAKVEIEFDTNPKLDLLLSVLSEIPQDRKVVVFCDFIHSGKIIEAAFKKEKIRYSRLYGGTKRKAEAQRKFLDDPKCRVFLGSQSAAYGLNLQVANYVLFFESPTSPIVRKQMEARCYRTGQSRHVFYYDLVVKGSVEERILQFLAEGRDLFQSLVEGKTDV